MPPRPPATCGGSRDTSSADAWRSHLACGAATTRDDRVAFLYEKRYTTSRPPRGRRVRRAEYPRVKPGCDDEPVQYDSA